MSLLDEEPVLRMKMEYEPTVSVERTTLEQTMNDGTNFVLAVLQIMDEPEVKLRDCRA